MFWVKNEAEGFATQSGALSGVALKWNGSAAHAGGPADASKVASSGGGHPQRKAAQKEYRLIAGTLDSGTHYVPDPARLKRRLHYVSVRRPPPRHWPRTCPDAPATPPR